MNTPKIILDIPDWMHRLAMKGNEINDTMAREGYNDWELGHIASRSLVFKLREEVKTLQRRLEVKQWT